MAQEDEILERAMRHVSDMLIEGLKTELLRQGHRATGALINSIRGVVVSLLNSIEVQISYFDYGRKVNTGQPPGTYVPIKQLLRWMRVKKIGQSGGVPEIVVAKRIQRAIKREGTPTSGRRSNYPGDAGRLTGFQDYTVEETTGEISDNLMAATQQYVFQILHSMLEELGVIEIKVAV